MALVSDEDDNCDSDNEAFSCDPDPTRLVREFVESTKWEGENDDDVYAEGEEKKKEFSSGAAAQNNVFLCSKIRDSLSLIIDVIWPSLQKTRKKFCC